MPFKPVWMLVAAVILGALGVWLFSGPPPLDAPAPSASDSAPPPAAASPKAPRPQAAPCPSAPGYALAASANTASLTSLVWSPFGRAETGWETYGPFVQREIATQCAPDQGGFARALAGWQTRNGLTADGIFKPGDFDLMRIQSHRRRPFVSAFANGCPPAAELSRLAPAAPEEVYGGKPALLRQDALAAYRRLRAAARRDPMIAADPRNLTIVSGYRSPEEAAARCAGQDCRGPARVLCSAHRTGMAIDLFVGAAPGFSPASTDDGNRLFQSRTPIYRWLIDNAERFGFVPYVFEPWHWEYVGAPL